MAVEQQQKKQAIPPMTPRRKQFFKMAMEGLRVGFEGQDIAKVSRGLTRWKQAMSKKILCETVSLCSANNLRSVHVKISPATCHPFACPVT